MNPDQSHPTNHIVEVLERRFAENMRRHKGLAWASVRHRLEESPSALTSLAQMEASGGEPDVVAHDKTNDKFVLCDCSPESPVGRRSLCYDDEALRARKENKPVGSALGAAAAMGAELLTEEQYRHLQQLGEFDLKTSSWVATPAEIRRLGGALFCDRRYGKVFVYHNGVQSYYASRGFRVQVSI
jgi:Protein of unknown function (DUF4256)